MKSTGSWLRSACGSVLTMMGGGRLFSTILLAWRYVANTLRQSGERGALDAVSEYMHDRFAVDFRYELWQVGIVLSNFEFLYDLLYLVFSILGCISPFFFASHLIDLAFQSKSLRTVLRSVTLNGWQLVLTVGMTSIVIFMYSVLAFVFFRNDYILCDNQDPSECDSIDHKCDSIIECFIFHLSVGLRQGGGIGDVIRQADTQGTADLSRVFFDLSFFMIIIVILLAIIQGLIIDSFGELRDRQLQVTKQLENHCFICGVSKVELDKKPQGFKRHIAKEHNLWMYLFFFMHLRIKSETEFTGQESYVKAMLNARDYSFFPLGATGVGEGSGGGGGGDDNDDDEED